MTRSELFERVRRLPPVPFAIALLLVVVTANAWVDDDVWITLRTVDNFVNGFGLRWNTFERVQAFTHPLWMFLLSLTLGITGDGYVPTIGLSILLTLATLAIAWWRWRSTPLRLLWFAALLVSSKAFVDYSTSGLENPLTHALAMAFAVMLLRVPRDRPVSEPELFRAVLLASLAYFNRADSVLACMPGLAWMTWRAVRALRFRVLRPWLIGTLPASSWTVFAVVYFGFPVPNTAFAKLAGGYYRAPFFHHNGIAYFTNSLRWDPITLPLVGGGLVIATLFAVRRRRGDVACIAAGIALILLYTMRIGGDYMSGRAFALPYLLAASLLVEVIPPVALAVLAPAAMVVGALNPRSPFFRAKDPSFAERDPSGILDDHAGHGKAFSLYNVVRRKDWTVGVARRAAPPPHDPRSIVWGATGYHGYQRGPGWRTIDNLALSDALLARLPAKNAEDGWGRGHLLRGVPDGYVESVETAQNRIVDPSLRLYYEKLLVITTGPVLTWDRMRTIWAMNTGRYTYLVDEYVARERRPR